jgi:hypothetical protein
MKTGTEIAAVKCNRGIWDFASEHWFASLLMVCSIGSNIQGTIVGATRAIAGTPVVNVDITPLVNLLQGLIQN